MGIQKSWLKVACACSALALAVGCGDDEPTSPTDSGAPDGSMPDGEVPLGDPVLTIARFNAVLLATGGFVPERRPAVYDALTEVDSDVLCVQEVWQDDDWEAIVSANEDVRPHAERIEPMPGVPGLC